MPRLKNPLKKVVITMITALALLASRFASADSMSSTNYKIQADIMSVGGGRSTSTNYVGDDTVGDLATGGDLSSASYQACAGYECFQGAPYISFSVKQGTSAPGTAGAGVALGALSTGSVATSDGSTINSIFITAESNAPNGTVVTVTDANAALKRISTANTIPSSTATLTAGVAGYGLCVFSASQDAGSPTAFASVAPFSSACTKTTSHSVGGLTTSPQTVLQSSGALLAGTSELLVKAAISTVTAAGSDYADTLTFIATGTY